MDPSTLDTGFWLTAGAILMLLVMSGFFSGSETALTASSRAKLKAQADKGDGRAETAMHVTEDSERMIGAILLGNNVVNILSASLATALLTRVFGDSGVALATLGMTLLVLIFGEVLPKTYAIANPETVALRVAPVIRLLITIFAPVVTVVRLLVRGILRLFGVRTDPDSRILAIREEIVGAIALGHSEGAVEKEDRDRLLATLDLSDRTVEEVMKHRSEVEMINADDPPEKILAQMLASPHTRLPIYRGDTENILGILHAKDLLREVGRIIAPEGGEALALAQLDVLKVARKPYFVPETTDLDDQMRQFLKRRTHFALVVDEYGALRGLITLEDIIEEIVGDITDEFDVTRDQAFRRTETGDYIVDGAMTIRDLNRALDWGLPDTEANTVAGLVIHEAQTIPAEGQVFSFHGFRFEVMTRRENRITRLKVRPL
ncbi:HlyC/CorC family transporter [Gemmobacter nectariphilus]|uniref:HlyC/CorC family transporter n=1 Tax=Gemmobacter nectariphilus TaxID=220343 RepID=UPI0003FD7A09|nr:HlyC/CorC family transporter [Gemmobacter nectariphilus]